MSVMSISEFADWVRRSTFVDYIFTTENNKQSGLSNISVSFRFHEAVVSVQTGRVLFRDGENILCIGRIKEVRIYDDRDSVGTVFELVCPGRTGCVYRFLAD